MVPLLINKNILKLEKNAIISATLRMG